jgi:uncharacterized phage-associated protein
MLDKKIDFCINCRKETTYSLQKRNIKKVIRDKEYSFNITVAICDGCGEEMSINELIDKNIKEIDEQYRAYENIISIGDIEKLMEIYNIGKAPLSLALGFGEITITRYLDGQIPSKEYSDIMKKALSSPSFMKERLLENKDKIASSAYNKAFEAASELGKLVSVSDKMLNTISYIFNKLEEITPLTLQKILYFIQGESFVLNGKEMFPELCEAWVHGPVYPKVYSMFKDFKYNPIDDARFAVLKAMENKLDESECKTIDLVINTFGEYSGKTLQRITHNEDPWKLARKGYENDIPSNEVISLDSIKKYYIEKNKEYDFASEEGLKKYINDSLEKNQL